MQGLFDPFSSRDGCGFGLIAHRKGKPSRRLLEQALQSLLCMTHRGGIAADGRTGDGCGVLMGMPDTFLRAAAGEQGLLLGERFAVGTVFLQRDAARAETARRTVEESLAAVGLPVAGWRQVPLNESACGELARAGRPVIEQVFIPTSEANPTTLAASLFMARRRAEIALAEDPDFYICSLSDKVLSYKGLVMPEDLPRLYPDLQDPRMETGLCVFHQRFSTNTLPQWSLAQPFRLLAHNGEINTILGNRNWAEARTANLSSPLLPDLASVAPLVNRQGSDSSSLDNMLEVLTAGGMDLFRALRLLIPPAWENHPLMDEEARAFYQYSTMHMEPWDGPAGIVLTDGRYAVCLVDRNGLRPARFVVTVDDHITLASETGTRDCEPEDVLERGRVGPGEILAVDTDTGEILRTADIDNRLKNAHPYRKWLQRHTLSLKTEPGAAVLDAPPPGQLNIYMKQFQAGPEECDYMLRPLAEGGQEPIGSMGDDTPIAVLSRHVRPLYDCFRQQFAQVTNPPIDSLRETMVMSLETSLGAEQNPMEEQEEHARRLILESPVLLPGDFHALQNAQQPDFCPVSIDCTYKVGSTTLKEAISAINARAVQAVREEGAVVLLLSDRGIAADRLPIHSLLAVGAVHHSLVRKGLRAAVNILVESGSARDPHQLATLFGFGATAVYPYLGYQVVSSLLGTGEISGDAVAAQKRYRAGLEKGLLKILSKMGISTLASYRGAQLFEIAGLAEDVSSLCFPGAMSCIGGMNFDDIEADQRELSALAWDRRKPPVHGGLIKYAHGGEYHAFHPDVVQALHRAVQSGDYQYYQEYADLVNQRPVAAIRNLFDFRPDIRPRPLSEVEPEEAILRRFDSAGMSLGALSPEAHETLAMAMNRLGGRSNSGEGGEDPARYGTERNSRIKQVAAGRFGVTPHYLVNAEVLQIKIAQGAKPGEGGQLPGGKVNELIARLRHSTPGVTLISPPPHHDIYSIEDLAQLVYDLKQINPKALVSVKLVAEPGVGTIAAGVVKAGADLVTISGHDGGTAASPISSIRYAGSPWELGLSETHQALRSTGLRGRVRLQGDGGLKTGLDVVKAAILGAESFGFGTAPMVAMGCKYLRICHLNNCATGVATQNDELRQKHYIGTDEMVVNFFRFVARETREHLAKLGARRLEDVIGHTELLAVRPGETPRQRRLRLSPVLYSDPSLAAEPHFCQVERNPSFERRAALNERMAQDILPIIEADAKGDFSYPITNEDRATGARLSGAIAAKWGNHGMAQNPIVVRLQGTAGQSFGAWNTGGLHLLLEGDANDYVGKGMAGGRLVLRPAPGGPSPGTGVPIMGNTCLYGATGGELFAAGGAGERFGVRNSGCHAVLESVGDHCCEYMTGGAVVVLGQTGINFGAGMTGGFAFVLDESGDFSLRCNQDLVELRRLAGEAAPKGYADFLREKIAALVEHTDSIQGSAVLKNFDRHLGQFWLVLPKNASADALLQQEQGRRGEQAQGNMTIARESRAL